jgi:hypothetical protein
VPPLELRVGARSSGTVSTCVSTQLRAVRSFRLVEADAGHAHGRSPATPPPSSSSTTSAWSPTARTCW